MWHELKTWPEEFIMMTSGVKTFEVRKNDRLYGAGDFLCLREWDPGLQSYSGRCVTRRVEYIMYGPKFGLPAGMVVMAVVPA